ncbi:class I SAM-dependent methyltransferase [Bacillus sp. IB182487]|uniref:Class I SAM-dependent methyltransferase n=2 Tax=Metabacillus arenae TaxID=2771434 RepID=A0A926NKF8_9BACI|nr:class I SAM-dependent methyltransferase [Metabacillus arenae]
MIVTTAGRTNQLLIEEAYKISKDLQSIYIDRKKRTVCELIKELNQDILVVGKNRMELHLQNSEHPLFFHPNSASFRYKRLIKGESDPFLNACKLMKGDTLVDCTLGLGSDAIIASFIAGKDGQVIGVEGNSLLAYIVKKGLCTWKTEDDHFNYAMKRIKVVTNNHLSVLKGMGTNTADIVYFDPMFEKGILTSNGIAPLRNLAVFDELTEEAITEALRVARKRIVLKDHWQSKKFSKFGFDVLKRKTAKFHFGVIELSKQGKSNKMEV